MSTFIFWEGDDDLISLGKIRLHPNFSFLGRLEVSLKFGVVVVVMAVVLVVVGDGGGGYVNQL